MPNPATTVLNIGIAGLDASAALSYNIYNMLGQLVASGNDMRIDTAKLSKGIYNITVKTDKGTFSRKFIRE
ncbi:T9SS type A sorting domain-containing protein [Flavobacterium sp. 3HN19-14]|uniref:T9SS type A sorting domain-containing protein n=1 Tax=Flavobacterium sp. 3HN19-14 TaxID=3448133 RepID=UPI003EE0EAB0